MLDCRTAAEARRRRDETLADCRDVAPRAARVLEEGFEDAMTAMVLPGEMRLRMRTSNYLERLNREIKGRTSAVGVFPSEASAIRLVGSVLIEENDRWSTQTKSYYGSDYAELLQVEGELAEMARNQRDMAKAWAGSAAAILHTNSDLTSPDRRMAARV